MALPRVEKVEVTIKGTFGPSQGGPGSAFGSAGAPAPGMPSWLRLPGNLGPTAAVPAAFEFDAPQVGTFKLTTPQNGSSGPVRCISIAPDSPVSSCDLIFGTGQRERFTVSVGNPLIGCFDTDNVIVVPRQPFPNLAPTAGIDVRTTAWWDANVRIGSNGVLEVNWKIRLLLHRGDAIPSPSTTRAPMFAFLAFSTDPANGASSANDPVKFYVCVDGRRRIDFQSIIGTVVSGSPLLSIDLGDGPPLSPGGPGNEISTFVTNLLSNLPLTAGATSPVVKSYAGNPAQFARMTISGVQACDGVLMMRAWDE